jgi:pimeloyl-ACP methyl ester carboxylesterase
MLKAMQFLFRLWILVTASLVLTGALAAQKPMTRKPAKSRSPEILRSATGIVETGELNHALYRIDVPSKWNHSLVVYYHGYAQLRWTYHPTHSLLKQVLPAYERGYAILESGYSNTGWALDEAQADTESLRKYFVHKYGQPRETILIGNSMGGLLTSITLERNAKPYVGGLDLCGSVGPTYEAFTRRFAARAAFDVYFPDLLPPLVPFPSTGYPAPAPQSEATLRKISNALREHPDSSESLRNFMGLHNDADLAHLIRYISYVIADMQHKAGGNPFDNRNYLYTGTQPDSTSEDNRLNDAVRRYAADPGARRYLALHYTPTGQLSRPMLAVHTTYDPIVPGASLALYGHMVERAGFGENIVQKYVRRDGHCSMSADEIGSALDELVTWIHTKRRPTPGLLR